MRRWAASVLLPVSLSACGGWQSTLDPASPGASNIANLWWIMFWTTGVLSTLVIGGLFYAVYRARRHAKDEEGDRVGGAERGFILVAGAAMPTLVLISFIVLSVRTGASISEPPGEPELTIEVIGHMFWWEVRYPDHDITTANEIHIPVGAPVDVRVTSADVIHSFWVPQLAPGKVDMIPGRTNRIWMMAEEPGRFRGQCTEFCGVQHALMSLLVVAMPEEDFLAWISDRLPGTELDDPLELRGREVFFEAGCQSCHTIQGVSEPEFLGAPGPDLTHLAARSTLGGLTIENTRENLTAWILDPHHFKPGVRMPPSPLSGEDVGALVAYLETLQ